MEDDPKAITSAKPTTRMLKAAKAMVANGGKSTAAVLREAGYSEAVARNPSKVVGSKTFQDLLAELMPDQSLAEGQAQLLQAGHLAHHDFPAAGTENGCANTGFTVKEAKDLIESVPGCRVVEGRKILAERGGKYIRIYYVQPDNYSRIKALDSAYRLKGLYAPTKSQNENFSFSLSNLRRMRDSGEL